MRNSVSVAPRSTERLSNSNSAAKRRALLASLLAGISLNLAACDGESKGTVNAGGSGGAADAASIGGSGGTGELEAGVDAETGVEDGGDAEVDPCKKLEFDGLASKRFAPGETGSFTVNFDSSHPDSVYNGTRFEMVSGDVVTQPSQIGLTSVVYVNYQTNDGEFGDISGVVPVVFNPDQHFVMDDEWGDCRLNLLPINEVALLDSAKRPLMESPDSMFVTVLSIRDDIEKKVGTTFLAGKTQFSLDALTSSNIEVDYLFPNTKPKINASAFREQNGFITVDLMGTTDEGHGTDDILSRLGVSADSVTLEPIPGQPGKYTSTTPSSLTSLSLSVAGLNEGVTGFDKEPIDDTTVVTVDVSDNL